jgi:hypothetical protein
MTEMETDVNAGKLRTENGVERGSGSCKNFDVSISGGVGCDPSELRGAFIL